ncbi:unnamed protein product [Acanthocheilonema viteae]|uniref:Uncharacterized protein n=1 Tax=Acanthocheilonema viteae TaxID=6277 RepID=A0A498S588_ACAVI|nr:unnamed protein product [Acanthocheilonema viteae]
MMHNVEIIKVDNRKKFRCDVDGWQNFELQSQSFRSRDEFDDFMQYIKMGTDDVITTISGGGQSKTSCGFAFKEDVTWDEESDQSLHLYHEFDESASENEHDIIEIAASANISGEILSCDRFEYTKYFNALLVKDIRLVSDFIGTMGDNQDLVFYINDNSVEELNYKVSDALSFAKQSMIYQTNCEISYRKSDHKNISTKGITSCANMPEIHKQSTIDGREFSTISGTLTCFHEMGNFTV